MEQIGVLISLGILGIAVAVLHLRLVTRKRPEVKNDAPQVDLGPLEAKITKNAEAIREVNTKMKAVEQEWTETYAKIRRAQGRLYRDEQVKDGKHKGAPQEEEREMATAALTHEDVARIANRRRLGLE